MDIKKTSDYSIFKRVIGNRPVDINHVKSLTVSVNQKNLLENIPLIVNAKMQVIDGQHRLEVAKALGLPVYYIEVEGAGIDDVRRLNSYARPWSMKDYLEGYIELGNIDYKKLKAFSNKYGISISLSLILLNNPNGEKGKKTTVLRDFKAGKFSIEDLDKSEEHAKRLAELRPYLEPGVDSDREFVQALVMAYNTISHLELMEQFKQYPDLKIKRGTRVKDYLRQIEDVISRGTRREIHL